MSAVECGLSPAKEFPKSFSPVFPVFICLGMALAAPATWPQDSSKKAPAPSGAATPASATTEKPKAKGFPSPEAAAAALSNAARENDSDQLLVILGPEGQDLVHWSQNSSDIDEQRHIFADKYDQMHRVVREPDNTVALYVGAENWPLPIPIVEYNGAWYFDAELGRQEILYRRIGRNEISAVDVSAELVEAEKEFFGAAHNYTSKFVSTAGSHDGLYWKSSGAPTRSPVGLYLAQAGVNDSVKNHQPFFGYFYRIVLRSGAAGDVSGFLVEAFPAEYRSSGVMTFLTDDQGTAYEKDLGPGTPAAALQLTAGSLDDTWKKVE